jgi:SAM-dependent methyltransferase
MDKTDDDRTLEGDLDQMWGQSWKKTETLALIKNLRKAETMRWKLKYAPMHGKFLEAGCGMGQYVFYLMEFGFDIEGVDISSYSIEASKRFAQENGYDPEMFRIADVRKLPHKDNSFSFYLSLGVVEHFKEGPMAALNEAFRVLKPGGLAYIATPTKYIYNWIFAIHKKPKNLVKKLLVKMGRRKNARSEWVEYRWKLGELVRYIQQAGFTVVDASNVDLKAATEIGLRKRRHFVTKIKPRLFPILDKLEDGFFGRFGLNNVVVARKPAEEMHCFFCGELFSCRELHLEEFSVPCCNTCVQNISEDILNNYHSKKKPFFKERIYRKEDTAPLHEPSCSFCEKHFTPDPIYGDYGFARSVCKECLKNPTINLKLRNLELKYDNRS